MPFFGLSNEFQHERDERDDERDDIRDYERELGYADVFSVGRGLPLLDDVKASFEFYCSPVRGDLRLLQTLDLRDYLSHRKHHLTVFGGRAAGLRGKFYFFVDGQSEEPSRDIG